MALLISTPHLEISTFLFPPPEFNKTIINVYYFIGKIVERKCKCECMISLLANLPFTIH